MDIQIGDRLFKLGKLEYSNTNWVLRSRPNRYISASLLEEWEQNTTYGTKNPTFANGHTSAFFDIYNDANYTHSDVYAFPGFKLGDDNYVLTWYTITGHTNTVSTYPMGSKVLGFSLVVNNQLLDPTLLSWNFGIYTMVNPAEQGIGLYSNNDQTFQCSFSFGTSNFTSTGQHRLWSCRYTDAKVGDDTGANNFNQPVNRRSYLYNASLDLANMLPPEGVSLKTDDEPTSGEGGADGTFDPFGDDVDYPDLPTNSAVDTGLLTVYEPSIQELKSISAWLWSMDDSIFDQLKKIYSNVMDYIVSLQFLPIISNNTSTSNVYFGNTDTEILSKKVNSQYIATDEVTISIDEYYGSFIDYAPTKIMLYLPFIGFRELSSQDVMAGMIGVKYHIDIITGDCVAFVKVYSRTTKSVLYTYNGNCASQAPLSGRDFAQIFSASVNAVASIGTVATGNPTGLLSAGTAMVDLMQAQNSINRGGAISGNAGFLTEYQPYLIFARPSAAYPDNYAHFYGKPSNITRKLSTLSGFTSIKECVSDGFGNATDDEVNEIKRLLKEGVYL